MDISVKYHRRLAAIGVPVPADRGVPVADPFADVDAEPFTGRVGGGRDAFKRCRVFIGNLVL